MKLTDADKQLCFLMLRYKRLNPTTLIRIGRPTIEVSETETPNEYPEPLVEQVSAEPDIYEVRLTDTSAVNLKREDLLGEFLPAARRCEAAVKARFPGVEINERFSEWFLPPED